MKAWEHAAMHRHDHNAKPKKVDLARLCAIATSKYNERLRDAFGLWFHVAVEENEFLSAESGSEDDGQTRGGTSAAELEQSMQRSTRSWLGPFYDETANPRKAIGDIVVIHEADEDHEELSCIKEVYLRQHRKLVSECAQAHTDLMQTCSVRLVSCTQIASGLKKLAAIVQRETMNELKVHMLQGIVSGKQQPINTYEMDGEEVKLASDPANNLKVARGTLGSFRPTYGRTSINSLSSVLMDRFYSRNGTNLASMVKSPQLIQTFLSYAKVTVYAGVGN